MLTLENLKEIKPGIFASGIVTESRLHAREVKWVAVRGGIHDWAIYYHKSFQEEEWIKDHGDKCFTEKVIKELVPCDDEAFKMYRF